MATYVEIRNLYRDPSMIHKTEMATAAVVTDILAKDDTAANGYDDTPENHEDRLKWAIQSIADIRGTAKKLLWPILIIHKAEPIATIIGVSVTQFVTDIKSFIVEYCRGTQLT